MTDTGFCVPAAKLHRFISMYAPAEVAGRFGATADGPGLAMVDRPDGWYAAPPALPDGAPRGYGWEGGRGPPASGP